MKDPKKWFRAEGLIAGVKEAIAKILHEPLNYATDEPGRYEYWLFSVVSGAAGQYQVSEIIDAFGLHEEVDPEHPYVYEEMQPYLDEFAKEATRVIHKAKLPGKIYATWHEADNDFGFMYVVDLDGLGKLIWGEGKKKPKKNRR